LVPPSSDYIKINCDGYSYGSPPCGAIGVVFRNSVAAFVCAFAQNIGYATPLETDSLGIVKAFDRILYYI